MKKLIYGIFSLALVVIVFFSCDNDEIVRTEENSMLKSNFVNPFESVGIQHNEDLVYIFNIIQTKPNSNEIISTVENILENKYSTEYDFSSSNQNFPNFSPNFNFVNWLSQLGISQELENQILDTYTIFETSNSLTEIKDRIYQKEINAQNLLSGNDLDIYYAHLAVAKYSATFWLTSSQGGSNGTDIIVWASDDMVGAIDPIELLKADVSGLLRGGLGGAVAASAINVLYQLIFG